MSRPDENPLISVVMPAFDCEQFIGEAVTSVINQTYQNWQLLIVVDTKSNEETFLRAEEFQKKFPEKIYVIKNSERAGVTANRNLGIQKASGEWIAFLDADDSWLLNKLEIQVQATISHERLISCHSFLPVNQVGEKLAPRIPPQKISYLLLLKNNVIGCSTVLIHKKLLSRGFPAPPHEDYRLWLMIAKEHPILGITDILSHYRIGHESASSNKIKSAINRFKILWQEPIPLYQKPCFFLAYAWSGLKKNSCPMAKI